MSLSQAGLQAALAQHTDEAFLECLTIAHPSVTTIRLVNDRQDLTRSAGTFIAFPFRARLQPKSEDRIAEAEIIADNVDQRIITALRGLSDGATATYEVVLADTPNTVEAGPFEFEIMGFSADAATITLRVSGDYRVLNEAWPKDYFAPWNAG
jgi:hypothetical protein